MWKPSDIGWGILCLIEGIVVLILGVWVSIVGLFTRLFQRLFKWNKK